jgi:hypothetical protein
MGSLVVRHAELALWHPQAVHPTSAIQGVELQSVTQ